MVALRSLSLARPLRPPQPRALPPMIRPDMSQWHIILLRPLLQNQLPIARRLRLPQTLTGLAWPGLLTISTPSSMAILSRRHSRLSRLHRNLIFLDHLHERRRLRARPRLACSVRTRRAPFRLHRKALHPLLLLPPDHRRNSSTARSIVNLASQHSSTQTTLVRLDMLLQCSLQGLPASRLCPRQATLLNNTSLLLLHLPVATAHSSMEARRRRTRIPTPFRCTSSSTGLPSRRRAWCTTSRHRGSATRTLGGVRRRWKRAWANS